VPRSYDPGVGPSATPTRVLAGYLAGIGLGTTSITLLFLGMRAVMDVGGACADGGPYVSAQPCPAGVPLAMIGGMFGLFGSAGLIVWFGSRIGVGAASIVALGWPLLFLSLGFNFLDYAFHPPDTEATPVWGWLIPGALFWLMGGAPLAVGIAAWRQARAGRPGNRLSRQVTTGIRIPGSSPYPSDDVRAAQKAAGLGRLATDLEALATDAEARPVGDVRVEYAPNAWGAPRPAAAPSAAVAASSDPATAEGGPADQTPARSADPAGSLLVHDLARLAELHESGALTDAEFAEAKRDRLAAEGES
jgi:putative oligomerization/nucleic acid binding protein